MQQMPVDWNLMLLVTVGLILMGRRWQVIAPSIKKRIVFDLAFQYQWMMWMSIDC